MRFRRPHISLGVSFGLGDSASTVLGRQIVCTARAFAAMGFKEALPNNGDTWITELWKCYIGSTNDNDVPAARAYCTVAAWVMVQEACRMLDCENILPGYRQTWGNTRATLERADTQQQLRIDKTPAIGAMFYRRSLECTWTQHEARNIRKTNRNACPSSGHSGIVVDIVYDSGGGVAEIHTVEGNASTQGNTSEGIQEYVYKPGGAIWYADKDADWYFIHIEEMPCSASDLASGTVCLGVSVNCRETSPPPAEPLTLDPDIEKEYQEYRDKGGSSTKTYITEKEKLHKDCKDRILLTTCCDDDRTTLKMPGIDGVINYRDLQNRPEIFSAMIGGTASVPYFQTDRELWENWRNRFPMVTDNNGNRIFVVIEGTERYRTMKALNLWGPGQPFVIVMKRTGSMRVLDNSLIDGDGDGYKERIALISQPPRMFGGEGNWGNASAQQIHTMKHTEITAGENRNRERFEQDPNRYRQVFKDANFFRICENIERAGKFDHCFVLLFSGQPKTFSDFFQDYVDIVRYALVKVVGGGFAGELLNSGLGITKSIVLGQKINPADYMAIGKGLMVQAGLPEAQARQYATYLDKTAQVFDAYSRGGAAGASATVNMLREFGADYFPEETKWVNETVSSAKMWAEGAYRNIQQHTNAPIDIIKKTVDGYGIAHIARTYGAKLQNNGGNALSAAQEIFADLIRDVEDFKATAALENVPVLRNFLASQPHATMLAAFPNAGAIIEKIINIRMVYDHNIEGDPNKHMAFASVAGGYEVDRDSLKELHFASLMRRGELYAENGWIFELSDNVPEEYRECWEHEIRICTKVKCCPPKIWYKGACVDDIPKIDIPEISTNTDDPGITRGTGTTYDPDTDTPRKIVLPPCIRETGGEFFYCPPNYCDAGSDAAPEEPQAANPADIAPGAGPQWENPTAPVAAGPTAQGPPLAGVSEAAADMLQQARQFFSQAALSLFGRKNECPVMYPAKVAYPGTIAETWYAYIGGVWVALVSCCPQFDPENCCEENTKRLTAIGNQLSRLYELYLRRQAGEKTPECNTESISRDIQRLQAEVRKSRLPETTIREILRNIKAIHDGLRAIPRTYDDTKVRQAIEQNRQILERLERARTTVQTGGGNTQKTQTIDISDLERQVSRQSALLETLIAREQRGEDVRPAIEQNRQLLLQMQSRLTQIRAGQQPGIDISALERQIAEQKTLLQSLIAEMRSKQGMANYESLIERRFATLEKLIRDIRPKNGAVELHTATESLRETLRMLQTGQIDTRSITERLTAIETKLQQAPPPENASDTSRQLSEIQTALATIEQSGLLRTQPQTAQRIQTIIREIEKKSEPPARADTSALMQRIAELEQLIRQNEQSGGKDSALRAEISALQKELQRRQTSSKPGRPADEDCPDCAKVVEKHERIIYQYPDTHCC